MKETTLLKLKNQVTKITTKCDKLANLVEDLYMELTYQRQLNETLANVCKQLPDWDKAIEAFKKLREEEKEKDEEDSSPKLDLQKDNE